jgi:hypothetical protein
MNTIISSVILLLYFTVFAIIVNFLLDKRLKKINNYYVLCIALTILDMIIPYAILLFTTIKIYPKLFEPEIRPVIIAAFVVLGQLYMYKAKFKIR